MKGKKGLQWTDVSVWEGEPIDNGGTPAVRLTYAVVGRQSTVLFSHTPGVVRDGEFVPTMHLRDNYMVQYMPLLEHSARVAAKIRARYDNQSGRERLTSSIAEALKAKS